MVFFTQPINPQDYDEFSTRAASYDWQIAGMKFASAVDADNPMERAFARVTKEAIDQSPQPGDQSLDGWWVRSQTDWSGGAGYRFMEPMSEDPIPKTFNWSYGVDVWSEGKLTLLRRPRKAFAPPNGSPIVVGTKPSMVSYSGYIYFSVGTGVYRFSESDLVDDSFSSAEMPTAYATFSSDVTKLLVAGGYLLAFTLSHGVYRIASGSTTQLFTSTQGPILGWFVKDRLILTSGASLYDQPIPTSTVALNAETPLVTNIDPSWQWVSITDSPGAILAAGRGSSSSTISAISLEADGGLPTLAAPTVVAEMPRGEQIRTTQSYLGSYLLISTTQGIRLGIIDSGDRIVYGPLIGAPITNSEFSAYDKFAYASVTDAGEGRAGLIRLDLSKVTQENKVPWANDVRVDENHTVFAVTVISWATAVILTMDRSNNRVHLFVVTPTGLSEDYGALQSGAIRMGSTVEKNWARVGLTATPPMRGKIQANLITPNAVVQVGSLTNPEYQADFRVADTDLHSSIAAIQLILSKGGVVPPESVTAPTLPDPDPIVTPVPGIPEPDPGLPPGSGEYSWNTLRAFTWLEVQDSFSQWLDVANTGGTTESGGTFEILPVETVETFDNLNPGTVLPSDSDTTPVLEAWVLKAIPAIERTELMRIPLSCFDWELDSRGQKVGGQGTALSRYEELTTRAGKGTVVDLRNLNTKREFKVVVDDLSFRQTAPGSRGSGFGGVVDLVVRVLA